MSEVRGFGAFLRRLRGLSLVRRWNFHYITKDENVAEHSYWVAIYAMVLYDIESTLTDELPFGCGEVIQCALVHDWEEAVTGDLPSLVKKTIPASWQCVADKGFAFLIDSLPQESKDEYYNAWRCDAFDGKRVSDSIRKMVHAADLLDRLMYGYDEQMRGNKAFDRIIKETIGQLRKLKLKSVHLILDELGYRKEEGVELPKLMTHL